MKIIKCIICNNEKEVPNVQKYCSKECYWKSPYHAGRLKKGNHKFRLTINCIICGKERYTYDKRSKYCSQKCSWSDLKNRQKGEKNPMWKDIISKEELVDLYINQKLGMDKIAKIKSCGWADIKRRLNMWDIKQRPFKESINIGIQQNIHKYREASLGKNNPMYGKVAYPKAYFVQTLGHKVRSSWEEMLANRLKNEGIEYKFEPITFKLKDKTYTPDFIIGNKVIEVKGALFDKQLEKMKEFCRTYPNYEFIILGAKCIADRINFCVFFDLFGNTRINGKSTSYLKEEAWERLLCYLKK